MNIFNMQFNMSHPIDIIFKAINDLLEMSEYALMPISSSQAVNLAYVVFEKNPIRLQRSLGMEPTFSRILHMGCHENTPSRSPT